MTNKSIFHQNKWYTLLLVQPIGNQIAIILIFHFKIQNVSQCCKIDDNYDIKFKFHTEIFILNNNVFDNDGSDRSGSAKVI